MIWGFLHQEEGDITQLGGIQARVISFLSDDPSGIIRAKGRSSQLLYTLKRGLQYSWWWIFRNFVDCYHQKTLFWNQKMWDCGGRVGENRLFLFRLLRGNSITVRYEIYQDTFPTLQLPRTIKRLKYIALQHSINRAGFEIYWGHNSHKNWIYHNESISERAR